MIGGVGGDAVKLEKNLRMLQRIVPGASDILAQSPFVAVYAFDEGTQAWAREDIEGGLFLVRRGEPGGSPLALVVINRANANNLVRLVGDGFEMDDSDEYLMFRSPEGVYGLWFRYAEEKARVHAKLAELVAPPAPAPAPAKVSGSALEKDRASGQMPALLQQMFLAETDRSGAPAAPAAPASFGSGPGAAERFEMSKEQMKDVLLRLVQTDKFIDILHGQYLQKLRRDEEHLKPPSQPMHQQQQQQHQQLGSPGAAMPPHSHTVHQQPVAPSPLRQPAHNMYHPHMPPPPFMYSGSPIGMGPPGGPPPPPPPPPNYGYHPPPR